LSNSQREILNHASVVPGTGEQAEPLVGFTPDGLNRAVKPGADPEGPNRAVTTAAHDVDLDGVKLISIVICTVLKMDDVKKSTKYPYGIPGPTPYLTSK
jgi:hypothetical protein